MTEDLSVSTEADPSSLNRSYDTAITGRRARSSRSSARRPRVRAADSTSSMPTSTTDDGEQKTVVHDGEDMANNAVDNSGLLSRRHRRRRANIDTEKDTSVTAEPPQLILKEQPVSGTIASSADSDLLDLGSPRNTDTVKTKKRAKKKPRGSSEALSSNVTDASVDQEFEPDLSISKDFSQSFEMRTSSPVERMFTFKPQPVISTTENNVWMMNDVRLNDVCKQLLMKQNFDKSSADLDSHKDDESNSKERRSTTDDSHEREPMEVEIDYRVHPTASVSQPVTAVEMPSETKSQENRVSIVVLPSSPSSTMSPTTTEQPKRQKSGKHKKQVEDVPVEQQKPDNDGRFRTTESNPSEFSTEPEVTLSENIPTETYKSKRVRRKKQPEDVSAEIRDTDSRFSDDSRPAENIESEMSTESDAATNKDVPGISSSQESKVTVTLSSPDSHESALRETSDLGRSESRGMPDVIPPSTTPEPDEATQAADDDGAAAEELEKLEREQRLLMEEQALQQQQKERERLEKENQEREREDAERQEKIWRENEEKERRRRERKKRKELEKRQRELLANELPADEVNEPQTDNNIVEHTGSPAASPHDSQYTTEIVDVKTEEPEKQVLSVTAEVPRDRYADIPMVDDFEDEENVPPADYVSKEQTPLVEKSARKKPPSGRKMPPRSPLFPAPVPPKPGDDSSQEQKVTLTYFNYVSPRTTLKEVKARDRASSARQRSRSADRSMPHDRGQTYRSGSHFTLVDIDIESAPTDSVPASLSTSFDAGRPFSASSPIPPDFSRRSLRPARSEEVLFVKKLTSRSPTPSCELNDSSFGDGTQWIRTAKSIDFLNRSSADSEFSGGGLGRRSMSREWQVVTTTTKEEMIFVKRPGEDSEERKRIKEEYEKNKQVREQNEDRLTKEREQIERERLERLLAELRRRRQKERQQLLAKKLTEKKAKEENERFIREAIEQQRQKRLDEDKARREEEQNKRDELNERWRRDKEERENLAREKREKMEQEHQEELEREQQLRLQMEEKEAQQREEERRQKREKEARERHEREQKERLERERRQKEKSAREEKLRLEQMEREAKLLREKMEKQNLEKEEAKKQEAEKDRLEKEREMMDKLAYEHRLKLKKLEEETRYQQEHLERERLEKERELMEKLAQEHRLRLEKVEEETRLKQEQLEREEFEEEEARRISREKLEEEEIMQEEMKRREIEDNKRREDERSLARDETTQEHEIKLEKSEEESRSEQEQLKQQWMEREEITKQETEEWRKLELERLEREALEKIIQEQKVRLEKLEREEKLRAEKMEKHIEKDEETQTKRTSRESKEDDRRMSTSAEAEQENDSVFDSQTSTNLLPPRPRERSRLSSKDMATQTDGGSGTPATVIGQVRHYPTEVVTERLVSESDSPKSSLPIHNTITAPVPPVADSPIRRRSHSAGSVDKYKDVSPVVMHEYSELLSFWREDPTGGRLTLARATSRSAAVSEREIQVTVRDNIVAERWSSRQAGSDEQAPENHQPKPEPVRHQGDENDRSVSSSADDHDVSDKSFVRSTLGWVGQYLHTS